MVVVSAGFLEVNVSIVAIIVAIMITIINICVAIVAIICRYHLAHLLRRNLGRPHNIENIHLSLQHNGGSLMVKFNSVIIHSLTSV